MKHKILPKSKRPKMQTPLFPSSFESFRLHSSLTTSVYHPVNSIDKSRPTIRARGADYKAFTGVPARVTAGVSRASLWSTPRLPFQHHLGDFGTSDRVLWAWDLDLCVLGTVDYRDASRSAWDCGWIFDGPFDATIEPFGSSCMLFIFSRRFLSSFLMYVWRYTRVPVVLRCLVVVVAVMVVKRFKQLLLSKGRLPTATGNCDIISRLVLRSYER